MEKITTANKANKATNETVAPTIDKNSFDAFIKAHTNANGDVRAITINTFVDWFAIDGKRVRSFIRGSLKLNAPVQQNGSPLYVFRANDPIVKTIFDRFANGTANNTARSKRVAYDEQGFLVRIENI
jgi:hypothetical protein